jgi:hypothetical protein
MRMRTACIEDQGVNEATARTSKTGRTNRYAEMGSRRQQVSGYQISANSDSIAAHERLSALAL